MDKVEGEVAVNSQAKGSDSDDTLESQSGTEEANSACVAGVIFQVNRQRRTGSYGIDHARSTWCVLF